jgi:hypothetical protein
MILNVFWVYYMSKTNTKMLLTTQMLEPTDQQGALPYSGEERR